MNRNILILAVFLLIPWQIYAQHVSTENNDHLTHYKNFTGLFVGNTIISPSGFNLPTIGLEYVRELNRSFGIGIIMEAEIGSHIIEESEQGVIISEVERKGAFLVLPALVARVYKGLYASVGYGVEFEESENLGLFKANLEYKLELNNPSWIILPTISWDHTKRFNGWVYGVNFGYRF